MAEDWYLRSSLKLSTNQALTCGITILFALMSEARLPEGEQGLVGDNERWPSFSKWKPVDGCMYPRPRSPGSLGMQPGWGHGRVVSARDWGETFPACRCSGMLTTESRMLPAVCAAPQRAAGGRFDALASTRLPEGRRARVILMSSLGTAEEQTGTSVSRGTCLPAAGHRRPASPAASPAALRGGARARKLPEVSGRWSQRRALPPARAPPRRRQINRGLPLR